MRIVAAANILQSILDSLVHEERITEDHKQIIKRIFEDCVYDKKVLKSTIEHLQECFPESFEKKNKK